VGIAGAFDILVKVRPYKQTALEQNQCLPLLECEIDLPTRSILCSVYADLPKHKALRSQLQMWETDALDALVEVRHCTHSLSNRWLEMPLLMQVCTRARRASTCSYCSGLDLPYALCWSGRQAGLQGFLKADGCAGAYMH